jgi:hypothetical protein
MSVGRAVRYRTLVRDAAKQLGVKPSSERAKHVATLRFARETFADRLVAGRDVNPDHLLKLDEALKAYLPEATSAPPSDTLMGLRICRKLAGVCEACGHIQQLDIDVPPPGRSPIKPPLLLPAPSGNGVDHG